MPTAMSSPKFTKGWKSLFAIAGLLALLLGLFFYRSFLPEEVHFSNDGPLAGLVEEQNQLPQIFTGAWFDLNSIGFGGGAAAPAVSTILRMLVGPIGYAKFLPLIGLFILGLGVWAFLRSLKLSPVAATLGALAAVFNSTLFALNCWGLSATVIAFGLNFFALALVMANPRETPWPIRLARLALAGLCVGMNVMEAADVGALGSILVAIFIFYKALAETEGNWLGKSVRGFGRVAMVAAFAGFIAWQTVSGLVATQIQGVAGTGQDTETKAQRWDFATQWSLPKRETLGILVPGLFGYKMDTPKDMMPAFQDLYRGGMYWGGGGRDPGLDRYLDSGGVGTPPPSNFMRFTGGQKYCGILVVLIAFWAAAQSLRRKNSPFTEAQKPLIWFWSTLLVICLLLAWGRFAPLFYGLLYQLPYFSTIRNPDKFLYFFSWAIVILFAYGVHALGRQLDPAAPKAAGWPTQLKSWWARASQFDRRWLFTGAGILGASVLGWLIYGSQQANFIQYLQKVGFPDEAMARAIAAFSFGQLGWFLLLFAVAIGLLTLILSGYFSGPRARIGAFLLGGFLLFDLGRADLPYVIHWDYKQKYEVGSLNPIIEFLRNKPYEHRVAKLLPPPLSTPSEFQSFDQLYGIEWTQHQFLYYNIQDLDIVQMPRMPVDLVAYLEALKIGIKQVAVDKWSLDQTTFPKLIRKWELTNTRYLLGPAAFLNVFNTEFDPGKGRFRIIQRFGIGLKPGVTEFHQRLEEVTAYPSETGDFALFEFTGALPRAQLYANWQVNPNDEANLKTLADANFDPAKTVLISTPAKNLPAVSTNETAGGTVTFKSYSPKHIVLAAKAAAPSVLLLNDHYDANWRVTVDGQPAELLRCNYIMRGVPVPAGAHEVVFDYTLSLKPLYLTLSALGLGVLLGGFLLFAGRRSAATP